ncbi:MAG: MBL fold metallo-hydrolase [Candidatus Thorarchaeota archaeon]
MIEEHIHVIQVPTPFEVGPVNCYLIEGKPLTLIDTGVKSSLARGVVKQGLNNHGYDFEDIEQILLTHGHVDHMGLANEISNLGDDVKVWIHELDAERITDYPGYTENRMHAYQQIAEECGVPTELRQYNSHRAMADYFLKFGESVNEVKTFKDGAIMNSGIGRLYCLWVPGHSLGSVCYVAKEEALMFSGDHILGDISSNPSLDFEGSLGISMLRYFDSLTKMEPFSEFKVLPGHREPISNLSSRIDELFIDYKQKLERAKKSLRKNSITVYDLSRELYGDYPATSLILALAETRDLALILEQEERAHIDRKKDILYITSV